MDACTTLPLGTVRTTCGNTNPNRCDIFRLPAKLDRIYPIHNLRQSPIYVVAQRLLVNGELLSVLHHYAAIDKDCLHDPPERRVSDSEQWIKIWRLVQLTILDEKDVRPFAYLKTADLISSMPSDLAPPMVATRDLGVRGEARYCKLSDPQISCRLVVCLMLVKRQQLVKVGGVWCHRM